jgi:aldehyde:ferredoxin oxidoreductase
MPQPAEQIKKQLCYGCINGCNRGTYKATDGDEGKLFCQASNVYYRPALGYYKEKTEVPFKATRLCDKYGLDTRVIASMVEWLSRCYKAGILTDENTGIPLSKIGSLEFIETLLAKISFRDGFGDVLAQGIYRAANAIGNKAMELITDYTDRKAGQTTYGARLYITTGLFYATEPRQPITQLHRVCRTVIKWKNWINGLESAYMSYDVIREIARKFWGSEMAIDFSIYEGKALAAKKIQDREYAIECLGLCDQYYPIMDVEHSEDHAGDPTIESRLYSAVTGNEIDEEGLCMVGEKVFNLQRAIFAREGHRGREDDQIAEFNFTVPLESDNLNDECLVPGKDGEPISRKGAVLDRDKYEKMLAEYYQLRGWDIPSGLQTRAKLEELHLDDIAAELGKRGLII